MTDADGTNSNNADEAKARFHAIFEEELKKDPSDRNAAAARAL